MKKRMFKASMLALGMMGAVAASTTASALNFGLPVSGLTVGGGITFGAPVMSVGMDFEGWVTMLFPDGHVFGNYNQQDEPTFHGARTPIKGHMVMDIGSGGLRGSATFDPFLFANSPASGHDVTFYSPNALLNLLPTNTLLLGNMLFDFGNIKDIPVSIVLDIGNLTTALQNTAKGKILKGILTAASDDTLVDIGDGNGYSQSISMGPVLVATTTWDTTDVDTDGDGQPGPLYGPYFDTTHPHGTPGPNPSGTTPLIEDTQVDATNGDIGIGGSPMKTAPFEGFSPNFDIVQAKVTCFNILTSCNTSSLPMPPLPPLSAQPFGPLLKLLPQL